MIIRQKKIRQEKSLQKGTRDLARIVLEERVFLQDTPRDILQRGLAGCLEDDHRREAGVEGLLPPGRAEAPAVPGPEPWEAEGAKKKGELEMKWWQTFVQMQMQEMALPLGR